MIKWIKKLLKSNTQDKKQIFEYFSDSPIELNESNDILWTKRIVHQIEAIIDEVDVSEECFVVWLQWSWWAWKSSIIKSLKENEWKFLIFHYSPWIYWNEVNLYEKFFDEFSKFIWSDEFCSWDKDLEKAIIEYKHNLNEKQLNWMKWFWNNLVHFVFDFLFFWLIFFWIWSYGVIINFESIPSWAFIILTILLVCFTITFIYSEIKYYLYKYKLKKYWNNRKTIWSIRFNISKKLWTLSSKIVIIIDDIDRLKPEKISSILQLVKSTANFNNIIYILSYDKEIVSNSINSQYKQKWKNYIDKFIQMEINLPKPTFFWITSLLLKNIDSFIEYTHNKYPWTNYKLGEVEKNEIFWFFKSWKWREKISTIRDIKRFINMLKTDFNLFHSKYHSEEINIWDFILIEYIKYSDLNFYEWIYQNIWSILIPTKWFWIRLINRKKQELDWVLKNNYNWRNDLFYYLFPIKKSWEIIINSKRILNPNSFDIYFSFIVEWFTNSQFYDIIEKINLKNINSDKEIINLLNDTGSVNDFIRRIRLYINESKYDKNTIINIENLIIFLINNEELLKKRWGIINNIGRDISWWLVQFLRHFVDEPKKYKENFMIIFNNISNYTHIFMYAESSLNLDYWRIRENGNIDVFETIFSDHKKLWEDLILELWNIVKNKFIELIKLNKLHLIRRWKDCFKVAILMKRIDIDLLYAYIKTNNLEKIFIKYAIFHSSSVYLRINRWDKKEWLDDNDIKHFIKTSKFYFNKKDFWSLINNINRRPFDKELLEKIYKNWDIK